jgi:hypothetical protein
VCKKANAALGFLRRNLRNVPETCRKTAYVTLVRSIMEYGATIWNPYLKRDIIQNRFVKKDYKSRETGAITRMREDLELETCLCGCSISGRLRFGVLNMDCLVLLVVCVFLVGNI